MTHNVLTSALAALLLWLPANAAVVSGLRTEHLENPVGIDNAAPRFSWHLDDSRTGAVQTSWRIIVTETESSAIVWDSGEVASGAVLATYSGTPLQPFTGYSWKVICTGNDGAVTESPTATFETGLMDQVNWKGCWISDGNDENFRPAPRFRKEFSTRGAVVSARAYIAAAGLYTLSINGTKVGDRVLDPAFTRYDRRILYASYDVTDLVASGANAVGVELGNGWYNHQPVTTWHFDRAPWRARPAFCMDIRIVYADGSEETISTNPGWMTSSDGPLVRNNLYTGESYDARRELDGWDKAGFDASMWKASVIRQAPAAVISAQAMTPIKESEEIEAAEIIQLRPNKWIYDFGRNIAGNAHLHLQGEAGTSLTLKYAERLSVEGRADQRNIITYYFGDNNADPFQTDIVTLGKGALDWSPAYSYKGFRYIEVTSSRPMDLGKDNVRAVEVHSAVPDAGCLESSSDLVNLMDAAARNSYLSNLVGYPTDCPQREKNGWTGDGHIAVETGLYNFDAFTVYEKWLADHRDEQQPNGVLPDIIPTCGWGYWNFGGDGNGLDWTSTIALIPWELYLFYGDDKPLRDCYGNIRRYVDFALTLCDGDGLVSWGRGDWVPVTKKTDKRLVCSCFLYNDLRILSRAAEMFGRKEDFEKYSSLAESLKKAINGKFLDESTGIYADGMQTALSLPLVFGVVPDGCRAKVAAALASKVAADGWHVNAGVHGTKAVLNALNENGYAAEAWRIASAEDFPGWGWWIRNGRTSFVENWRLDAGKDNSDNHIMFGDVAAWFHRCLGGIRPDPADPGFHHILLQPYFPKDMTSFRCSHESPYGTISSAWTRKGRKVTFTVTIPCGCSATFVRPDGSVGELPSGEHTFSFKN